MMKVYDIKGFSKYSISEEGTVMNKRNGKINGKIRKRDNVSYSVLCSDKDEYLSITHAKLLYCAVNGINPTEFNCERKYCIRVKDKNKKMSIENIEIVPFITIRKEWGEKKSREKIDTKTFYEQVFSFAEAVLSKDVKRIYDELNLYKENVIKNIINRGVSRFYAECLYYDVLSDTIINIMEDKCRPLHPEKYMRKMTITLLKIDRRVNLQLNENKHYNYC